MSLSRTSFTLDDETLALMDALKIKLATTRTGVLKQIVRRAAKAEGVTTAMSGWLMIPPPDVWDAYIGREKEDDKLTEIGTRLRNELDQIVDVRLQAFAPRPVDDHPVRAVPKSAQLHEGAAKPKGTARK